MGYNQYSIKFKPIEKDGEKTCTKCKLSKSLNMFTTNNAMKDKKEYYCRKCMIDIHKNGYAKGIGKSIDEIVKRVKIVDNKKQCCCCKKWKVLNCYSNVNTTGMYYSLCKECDGLRY